MSLFGLVAGTSDGPDGSNNPAAARTVASGLGPLRCAGAADCALESDSETLGVGAPALSSAAAARGRRGCCINLDAQSHTACASARRMLPVAIQRASAGHPEGFVLSMNIQRRPCWPSICRFSQLASKEQSTPIQRKRVS
jgi:hypothetical protein